MTLKMTTGKSILVVESISSKTIVVEITFFIADRNNYDEVYAKQKIPSRVSQSL